MSDLELKFKKAVYLIRNGPAKDSSNAEKLKVYALFKQATKGDCTDKEPWKVQLEAHAKWGAYTALKGKSKEEAMQEYIDHVASGDPDWESHEVLKGVTNFD